MQRRSKWQSNQDLLKKRSMHDTDKKEEEFCTTLAQGIEKIMNNHLVDFADKRNWNEFRDAYVLHQKVADILVDNMNYLRRIYFKNTKISCGRGYFKIEDGLRVCHNVCNFQQEFKKKR